jgi:hypothetical protein
VKQELFYAGASRGRTEIAIVTSDPEQLRESLGISSARPSAMELARKQSRASEQGIQHTRISNSSLRVTKSASVTILASACNADVLLPTERDLTLAESDGDRRSTP